MLRTCGKLKVIVLDSEDEVISIYSDRQRVFKQFQDQMEIIEETEGC